jgi:hypothetical protein
MVPAVQAVKVMLRPEMPALRAILPPLQLPLLQIVLPGKPQEAV